jgi:hypothetical protein
VANPELALGPCDPATFTVTTGAPPFTDDPPTARVTSVRAVPVIELRQRIDELRARYGLAAFAWTDASLAPRGTPIKTAHVTELRSALDEVYAAAGEATPSYTDTLLARGVPVKAVHLTEIRNAVLRLW